MKYIEPTLAEWLNQEPLPSEILQNEEGATYIPIDVIKSKLDNLDNAWSTGQFRHQFIFLPDNSLVISGSVELHIPFLERTIVGSATFNVQRYFPNTHWGETCLSLCIVSAAKNLGRFFGKGLNKEVLEPTKQFGGITTPVEPAVVNKISETVKALTQK